MPLWRPLHPHKENSAGHKSKVEYDNAAGALQDLSAYINSISGFDLVQATYDVTAFGKSSMEYILGLKGGQEITISGDWDTTLHTHMTGVEALTTGATQTLKFSPAGGDSGTPYVSVETIPSAVAEKVTWSATLQATGAVTKGSN